MNFHNDLIAVIEQNKEMLEWFLGLYNSKLETNVSLSEFGDLDIYVEGIDVETQLNKSAIIEVKSNGSLVQHYIRKQLPKYKEKFPSAKQFVTYSQDGSLDFNSLEFRCLN